ncbi:MAG TPA: DHA2 family efflux MFS transporter permease subunit [Candidatus Binatia bacterium]|nr:DHA2 family efflux MFS transporter permease subunit [Candidatus Binatia bacterium]
MSAVEPVTDWQITPARRWAITFSVMMVTVMQVLDSSVTNVALPHMQGSLSAGIEEMSWVITSFLAANAIIIPATGWLSARFGRRRFFLICTVVFTVSSFLSGIAPTLEFLVAMRVLQGLGGGPVIPMAQAIMWEIFPLRMRGTAMAVWGGGIMLAPILGPTVGGWIADNWSWRWIFYINLPIGLVGFLMVSVFLFDAPFVKKPRGIDAVGLVLMVFGFGFLQLCLDLGEKKDWFDSGLIVGLLMLAICAIAAFVIRELLATEPILDLSVFNDRNFAVGTMCIALVALGFNSSVLLVALYAQKILAWDAWNAGLVLAPGGLGTMISLMISGRLVARTDQRFMLIGGCLLNAVSSTMMTSVTLGMDYWSLAWPRFLQGFAMGFIFPPLQTLTLATIRLERLGNATAAYNVVRNIGGSVGVALATTLLLRRSQAHQTTLVAHLNVWDADTTERLKKWTDHFVSQGADSYTASRRALAMLYRGTIEQAQVMAYADDFWLISVLFIVILPLIPLMHRVRTEQNEQARERPGRVEALPAPDNSPIAPERGRD